MALGGDQLFDRVRTVPVNSTDLKMNWTVNVNLS